jgi:hypothetical protein
MLVDVRLFKVGVIDRTILSIIGDGRVLPERLAEGMYLCTHWNFDDIAEVRQPWRESPPVFNLFDFNEFGVCDTPEQAVQKLNLREIPQRACVSFVRIRRDEQPCEGGWRWHKWGAYIGDREPQCEYLHDEPEIEEVYTFHVYEVVES